jgi:hypothetical protein
MKHPTDTILRDSRHSRSWPLFNILHFGYVSLRGICSKTRSSRHDTANASCAQVLDQRGIALVTVILLVMVLSFLSATMIVVSNTELKIANNFKTSVQSLYNAEAGVQFALAQIKDKLEAGALTLSGSSVTVHYSSPGTAYLQANGKFPFSNWTTVQLNVRSGNSKYYDYTVVGVYGSSQTSLTAGLYVTSSPLVKGMGSVGAMSIGSLSTLTGALGSNSSISIGGTTVASGSATYSSGGIVTPVTAAQVDPLGAAGLVAAHNYSNPANNQNISAGIAGNAISGNKTLTTGNYYVHDINMSTLTINGSGPVNIYLDDSAPVIDQIIINSGSGPLTIYYHGNGSFGNGTQNNVKWNNGGASSNLSIICDSTVAINYKNNFAFSGLLYDPYGSVQTENNFNISGVLQVGAITTGNNLVLNYADPNPAVAGSLTSSAILLSWKIK